MCCLVSHSPFHIWVKDYSWFHSPATCLVFWRLLLSQNHSTSDPCLLKRPKPFFSMATSVGWVSTCSAHHMSHQWLGRALNFKQIPVESQPQWFASQSLWSHPKSLGSLQPQNKINGLKQEENIMPVKRFLIWERRRDEDSYWQVH